MAAKKKIKKTADKPVKKTAKKINKTPQRKPLAKKSPPKRKTVARSPVVRTPVLKAAPRRVAPRKNARASAIKVVPGTLTVVVSESLESRLKALANNMSKPLPAMLTQALTEFADTWEDHMRTVTALAENNDRMQLAVPQEESADFQPEAEEPSSDSES